MQGGMAMGSYRKQARRTERRCFRPVMDGQLEPRLLLSTVKATLTQPLPIIQAQSLRTNREPLARPRIQLQARGLGEGQAIKAQALRPQAVNHAKPVFIHSPKILVERGGKGVRILDGRGGAFNVLIETGPGTITAKTLRDGRFELTVFGTNSNSEVVINPLRPLPDFGTAHTFQPEFGIGREILEVAKIDVKTGQVGSILGYRTANLSGPIILNNDAPVERIALNRLLPGALIQTRGDLNTLNIFTDATLSGAGTGLNIGRDLNWFFVDGDLTINDGAVVSVSRDIGLEAQAEKGSDPGGQGAQINGNLEIGPGSAFLVGRDLDFGMIIYGNLIGSSRLLINGTSAGVAVKGNVVP